MDVLRGSGRGLAYKYDVVFCIFLAVLAYLGRENDHLVYPAVLYLFLLLLALNFAAILALRLWPSKEWLSALVILANCGVITGIVSYSGGPDSNLWVLYLLPIYTVSMLLSGREVAWITAGAVGFNTVFYFSAPEAWDAATLFEVCLEDGLFIFSAALTWRLVSAERRSFATMRRQREEMSRLEELSRRSAAQREETERLAAVGLLSAGIVHDLKSPLMVIRGYAEICLQEKSLEPVVREDIEKIDASALRCQELVSGILRTASREEGLRVSRDIHELIDSAVAPYDGMFQSVGIELRKIYHREPLRVRVVVQELERLLANLIANAANAMPSGGALTVTTKTLRGPGGRSGVQVLVEDTGPGLSEEALAKLFKPFSTTRPREGGTGLGLYLSREIALKHGGGLRAKNRDAGGARFILSLPMESAARGVPMSEAARVTA